MPRTRANTLSAAQQSLYKAVKAGKMVVPDACEMCGSTKDKILSHLWEDYTKPYEVTFICKKCQCAINPIPRPAQRPLENPSYAETKRLVCDFGWTYDAVGERYGRSGSSVWWSFRERAKQRGEWEDIKARIAVHMGFRVKTGHTRGIGFVSNGVGIYGQIEDWLRLNKAFVVGSDGVIVELSRTQQIRLLAARTGTSYSRLQRGLKYPSTGLRRSRAVALLQAIGEPLPEDWPESQLYRKREAKRTYEKNRRGAILNAKEAA